MHSHGQVRRVGWIDEEIYADWIVKVFIPHVHRRRVELNLVEEDAMLWTDGHVSRVSVSAAEALDEAHICHATILAPTSHVFQPLDRAFFGHSRASWQPSL